MYLYKTYYRNWITSNKNNADQYSDRDKEYYEMLYYIYQLLESIDQLRKPKVKRK